MIASRLVNELMLVSVLVAGDGAQSLADALEEQGASAHHLTADQAPEGFDLAILLAEPGSAGDAGTRQLVATLSSSSERLLFAPLPLGAAAASGTPALPQLSDWFEVFAEFGYQPVVEFDASFVSPGAFLVDRAAVAAEGDLAAFADRLQLGAGPAADPQRAPPDAGPARTVETGLRAKLAETEAELTRLRDQVIASRAEAEAALLHAAHQAEQAAAIRYALASAQRSLDDAKTANAGWEGLRSWVRALVADPARDTVAALSRDLPLLNAWRSPRPPIVVPLAPRLRLWTRLGAALPTLPLRAPPWRKLSRVPSSNARPAILDDTSLVRASRLFDAAWYVAATPDLSDHSKVDPVFHYVLVGSLQGADPGPWFDTAAYIAAHPEVASAGLCPLVHAIRTKADVAINSE